MAHTKTLQFYRNNTVVRPDTNNNKSALTVAREALDTNGSKNDGEITLVRYQEGDDDPVKTLAGIYRKNGNTGTWTYLTEFDYENYYTKDEIDDNEFVVAQAISDLSEEISEKQDELTSGINIKTINYTSVLGHGNISVQPTLVSGTNIKTINSNSLLGAGNITLTASDVGADVFVVNIEDDGNGGYTCDKTNAEIYAAWQAGRNIVVIEDSEYVYGLACMPGSNTVYFNGINYDESECVYNICIHTSNNVQTVNKYSVYLQHELISGTNIKTINNNSILGSGNLSLTASDVGAVTSEDLSGYAPLRTDDRVDYAYMPHFVLDGINKTEPSNASTASWNVAHTTNSQIAVKFQESTGQMIVTGFYHYTPSQYVTYFNKEDYKFYRWTGSAMVAISSTAAYTGSYNDLTDKPTIPAAQVNADWSASSGVAQILNKPTLATVATSGAYSDLSGIPSVVTRLDDGNVTFALSPNTFYRFTGTLTSLDLTLTAGTGLCIYAGKFTASSNWGGNGLTIPSTVTQAMNNDTVSAGGTYEFSILDNVMILKQIS